MDGSEELLAPSMGLQSSTFDLSCEMSFPLPSIGCAFFSSLFLMSVIIKYFYRAQKSQNSAKHLTVMHPGEPLLWGEVQTHRDGAEWWGVHHMPNRMGVGRGPGGWGGAGLSPLGSSS